MLFPEGGFAVQMKHACVKTIWEMLLLFHAYLSRYMLGTAVNAGRGICGEISFHP